MLQEEGAGMALFAILASIMGSASFFVVILYTGIVTASERVNADLMYASAIKPWQIILGKFFSGLILSLLLFSAVFPFFTLAYLLRGLDFYTFLTTTYLIFLGIHTINAVVIFIACAIRTMSQMIFVGFFGFFFGLPMALQGVFGFLFFFGTFGAMVGASSGIPWEMLATNTLFSLSIIGFFLVSGIVIVSPPSSNRMLPMRLFLTLWFILSLVFVLYIKSAYGTGFTDIFDIWCVLHVSMLAAFIPFITSERDEWNYRIRRTIPRVQVLRQFVFPFYTGAACGLVWWLGYLGAICVAYCLFSNDVSNLDFYDVLNTFCLILFVFNYFYTGMIIRARFLSRWLSPGKTWIVALVLCGIFAFGSALIYFLLTFQDDSLQFLERYDQSFLSILNPFQLVSQLWSYGSSYQLFPQSYGALIWTAALTPYLIYWLFERLYRFTPIEASEIITEPQS